MILYAVLRFVTGIALRWFYRDVRVRHLERVPPRPTPLIVAVNHPNALVDALLIGWTLPRRIAITAKATLFENPVLGSFLRVAGVIPLRRASDERVTSSSGSSNLLRTGERRQSRNTEAFRAIVDHLEQGGAVLIFPEGKSHDEPTLAPLRTGPARIALQAYNTRPVRSPVILPVGLLFERKEAPRSRVLVDIGEPIDVAQWVATTSETSEHVHQLTAEINRRLHNVTLNYATTDEAARTRDIAQIFASLLADPLPIGVTRSLADEVELERQLTQARLALESEHGDSKLRARAERLLDRLDAFDEILKRNGIATDDVAIPIDRQRGAWFTIREGALLAILGPIGLWGRLNHWLPFRLARFLGERDMTSRDQPAMRTILAGLALVALFYGVFTAAVARIAGAGVAIAYLVSLPVAADIDLRFTDRMRRARQRMRAYLHFRQNPELRGRLCVEHAWLASEVTDLARRLESDKPSPEKPKASRG